MQGPVGEGVEGWLDELAKARHTDDGAVDAAKGGEAKDFGGIVTEIKHQWSVDKFFASLIGLWDLEGMTYETAL